MDKNKKIKRQGYTPGDPLLVNSYHCLLLHGNERKKAQLRTNSDNVICLINYVLQPNSGE